MLTFNQIWWATRGICDRYLAPAAEPPNPYDLLWEGVFTSVEPDGSGSRLRTELGPVPSPAPVHAAFRRD